MEKHKIFKEVLPLVTMKKGGVGGYCSSFPNSKIDLNMLNFGNLYGS